MKILGHLLLILIARYNKIRVMAEKIVIQCDLANGDHYEGGLEGKPKQKQGYGVYSWANGDKFCGDW